MFYVITPQQFCENFPKSTQIIVHYSRMMLCSLASVAIIFTIDLQYLNRFLLVNIFLVYFLHIWLYHDKLYKNVVKHGMLAYFQSVIHNIKSTNWSTFWTRVRVKSMIMLFCLATLAHRLQIVGRWRTKSEIISDKNHQKSSSSHLSTTYFIFRYSSYSGKIDIRWFFLIFDVYVVLFLEDKCLEGIDCLSQWLLVWPRTPNEVIVRLLC